MPQISVIVPVYRAEAFLRKCTESILSQTVSDIELLLIEDGSPDQSGALCDKIATEDARVRVFHKENGGVSSARNLGMQEARGDYLAFADSDDWLPPDALSVLYNALQAAGADTAGGAHMRMEINGHGEKEPAALPAGVYEPAEIRTGILNRLVGERMGKPDEVLNGFVWRFLFSKAVVQENAITFDGAYLEDELFLMAYFCHAKRLAMVEESVYYYLQNPQSVTRRYLADYMQTFARFMEQKRALVEQYGLGAACPLWEENSSWSGLLIAIGNEFARTNPASLAEKRRRVQALCQRPEMARAIASITPQDLGRNKQMVADLVRKKHFLLLSLLYAVKNRG